MIGKRNSGFEIADGLLPWARQVILGSPRPVQTAVIAQASVRVRYLQPYEDAGLGGGTVALDLAVERIERLERGWRIVGNGTTRPGPVDLEVDEVIAATGFSTPLLDLGELGVRTVAQGRIPALTPFWESEAGSGIYFAGNATQGAPGLRKHGVGAASPAVHGFRYNARVMARHLAATQLGLDVPARAGGRRARPVPARRADDGARALDAEVVPRPGRDRTTGTATSSRSPHFVDSRPRRGRGRGRDGRRRRDLSRRLRPPRAATSASGCCPPHLLNDFRGPEHERELRAAL